MFAVIFEYAMYLINCPGTGKVYLISRRTTNTLTVSEAANHFQVWNFIKKDSDTDVFLWVLRNS